MRRSQRLLERLALLLEMPYLVLHPGQHALVIGALPGRPLLETNLVLARSLPHGGRFIDEATAILFGCEARLREIALERLAGRDFFTELQFERRLSTVGLVGSNLQLDGGTLLVLLQGGRGKHELFFELAAERVGIDEQAAQLGFTPRQSFGSGGSLRRSLDDWADYSSGQPV